MKKLPIHPFALATFPIVSLLANNISQVSIWVGLKPVVIALISTTVLIFLASRFSRDLDKWALILSASIFVFFSYGHIYQLVKNTSILNMNIGRHRYLFPAAIFLLAASIWLLLRSKRVHGELTRVLNLTSILLLVYPTFIVVSHQLRTQTGLVKASGLTDQSQTMSPPDSGELPDIYYIVLDTYTRADILRDQYGFDNLPFLDQLRELGFYVADCARSNYSYTQGSITSTLNLNYLPDLQGTLKDLGLGSNDFWVLLKQSQVRKQLEAIGYKTVAFETGYEWSRIRDADFYLGLYRSPLSLQQLDPFDSLLIDSTVLVVYSHYQIQYSANRVEEKGDTLRQTDFPHAGYVDRQLFILDQLPEIVNIPEPTFSFVHLLIPHPPYVFQADGEIWDDAGFYSGEMSWPVNTEYLKVGYINEIQFINQQVVDIVTDIIQNSKTSPVILIQGDHGQRSDRLPILSAYYLPEPARDMLYESISPVNSFRLLFDQYFGTNYGLLPDLSYNGDDQDPTVETAPDCFSR